MSKGIKRKYSYTVEDGTSSSTSSENSDFNEDSIVNRSNTDDEDYEDEWETVSIPYTKLPTDLIPVVNDRSGLNPNSFTNKYLSSGNVNSSVNDNTKTLNNNFKTKRNGMGNGSLDSTIETHSNFSTVQKFSVFRSSEDEDVKTNSTASPTREVLDHVFVHEPTAESSTYHQVGTQQNNTSIHQESPSSTDRSRSSSEDQPVPKRKVHKAKKTRSETSVKGLYSDVPLQSFVIQQFRIKHPDLNLSPRTTVQMETLMSDMVGRIADEAKNLVALSSRKRVDWRVLKYAIKMMLEHMKMEADVAARRSSTWLF